MRPTPLRGPSGTLTGALAMLIVSCTPAPGFDFYRCGWREEEQNGRTVRIGLCWPAGVTTLPDDALTAEQLDALRNDPGKRIKVRHVQKQAPAEAASAGAALRPRGK